MLHVLSRLNLFLIRIKMNSNPWRLALLSPPFYEWINWNTGRWSDLPTVTQLVSDGAKIISRWSRGWALSFLYRSVFQNPKLECILLSHFRSHSSEILIDPLRNPPKWSLSIQHRCGDLDGGTLDAGSRAAPTWALRGLVLAPLPPQSHDAL